MLGTVIKLIRRFYIIEHFLYSGKFDVCFLMLDVSYQNDSKKITKINFISFPTKKRLNTKV